MWLAVHIVFLIGFRNRLLVLINWTWDYFFYDRPIRLIMHDGNCPWERCLREAAARKTRPRNRPCNAGNGFWSTSRDASNGKVFLAVAPE